MQTVSEGIFHIDRGWDRGLQAQVRESVVAGVLGGRILPGARLPSTRKLAEYLGISRLTVSLAYQELVSQGYLEATERSGYRIAAAAPVARLRATVRGKEDGLDWGARLQRFSIAKRIRKPLDWRSYPYPFLYGQTDMSLFDLAAWRDCTRRALSRADFSVTAGDYAAADDPDLVQYISSRSLPRRGIEARPEEILVTVGAQNALWISIQLLLGPGRRVAFEEPGHPDIYASLILSGAEVIPVEVDADGLPPERLPERLDAVFVTPSHHAPTAVRMPRERRLRLLELAAERDFVIVEDDYEFEMSYLEAPAPALRSLDGSGRVLYVGSFSKSLFPGLRLGYLVGPPEFIREARALRALLLRHPPGQLQRTAATFLALGYYDALIRRMRQEYAGRYELMAAALAAGGLRIAGQAHFGGTCFWIDGGAGLDADAFADRLRGDGVLIESGAPFFAASEGPCRFFRMAFSSIARDRIAEGIAKVAERLSAQG